MVAKLNRIGERNYNTFGSEMIITKYRNAMNIDVYFPEYDWTARNRGYSHFKKGEIKCPYEPKVYGVGYIGEGKYKSKINGKTTRIYDTWCNMLKRCYDSKQHEKYPTYKNCKVCDEWLCFQNFAEWLESNYYEIEGETMCLDKDILIKHNKVYSPEACVFVPNIINVLFIKNDKSRGDSVIGTHRLKNGKYVANCHLFNPETVKSKNEYLGTYDTQEKAFEIYKYYKEKNIKEVAGYYKEQIPEKLYNGMYNYIVEITD